MRKKRSNGDDEAIQLTLEEELVGLDEQTAFQESRAESNDTQLEDSTSSGPSTPLGQNQCSLNASQMQDSEGDIEETHAQLFRIRKWQSRKGEHEYSGRRPALPQALSELDRLSVSMKLPEETRNLASLIVRKAWKMGLIANRSTLSFVAASVYSACRITGRPRRFSDVALKAGISKKKISATFRLIATHVDLQVPIQDISRLILKLGAIFNTPEHVLRYACKILESARKNDMIAGRDPWGLAASALYLASQELRFSLTQRELAKAAGVTEVTVRNRYQELRKRIVT